MKKLFALFFLWFIFSGLTTHEVLNTYNLKDGDIIFQSSTKGQGLAIQIATGSKYSHVGMIFKEGGKVYVYEAVQPVKKTELKEWIARGDHQAYVVKRLKEGDKILNAEKITQLKSECTKHLGKNYDLYFEWTDDKMYCSELVWKVYKATTSIEIGKLQKLKEFNLTNTIVKAKLKERYGESIPMEEKVISPGAIFESNLLDGVK
jgi:uncharacterized protein YycO